MKDNKKIINDLVRKFLRMKRIQANLRQVQVSTKMGKAKQWTCEVESGRHQILTYDLIILCNIYGTSLSELQDYITKEMYENVEKQN